MDLPSILLASLNPSTRSQAEATLTSLSSSQPQFLISLLQLVLQPSQQIQARQAAAVYFKNTVKRRWNAEVTEEQPIIIEDKLMLRSQLVPAMVSLSNPTDKLLRAQLADAVGVVAVVDFPEQWQGLISQLVAHLSPSDFSVNICVLETAHSIFSPWRSQMRSNELFATINFAVEQFQDAFFSLFSTTASLLLSSTDLPDLSLIAQAQSLLIQIYLDMTFHDIPPKFEDSIAQFWGAAGVDATDGAFLMFLRWDPPQLRGDDEDPTPTTPQLFKTTILELAEVFVFKYNELISARVPSFVRAVWELIGTSGPAVREDVMVAQAIKFLSVCAKSGLYSSLFKEQETVRGLVDRIVVPSMGLREHEVEQFEDDPLEYIRRDLSSNTEGGATRRHAASELVRALVSIGLDAEVTKIVQSYIEIALQQYGQNPAENWKSKDRAIYLLTAIASQASTSQHGVTSTNSLVDIIRFFSDNIYRDLSADMGAVHPILQVDAIRFLHTFRYQLTKEQLTSVLPLLIRHLASSSYVCYTYAAITIERILFIKSGRVMMFNHIDIQAFTTEVLNALFERIASHVTPEKVAENEYLMKCAMRVIITAKQGLLSGYADILSKLVGILGIISKNPSNPLFNQYTFESVSALLRYVALADAAAVTAFEAALFGPFTFILQQDIDQFIPYVFQILSQMLEVHSATLPDVYRSLLPLLLTPPVWQQKGNIPALTRLVSAFLRKDAVRIEAEGQLKTIIAIIQQRLLPSKINDQYGFELMKAVVETVKPTTLSGPYYTGMITAAFTRLQTSKTDKYAYALMVWFLGTMALPVEGLGPHFVVGEVEKVQAGIWGQLFGGVILPEIPKTRKSDAKAVVVGTTRLLTESSVMLMPQATELWQKTFVALEQLLSQSETVTKDVEDDDPDAALTAIDFEEQTAGYQAAFSKLAASAPARVDPVAYVQDPISFAKQELAKATSANPTVRSSLSTLPRTAWTGGLLSGHPF
ncbi:importin-alpha export receptor [Tulasnella sp. JGI-2019a]|nr:importin-alpha export receptor [Tulasnella sp. JGI-2019a]KAG8999120.1 importin-alpha export receptor [Tulasnella sp. JGI-2019a]